MKAARWVQVILVAILILLGGAYFLVDRLPSTGDVRRVDRVTPQLDHAIKSAQSSLPDYLKQLRHPKVGQRFAFMARFRTPDGNEYLWVKDPSISGKRLAGTLDQPPMAAQLRKGDFVTVDTADVVDWYIRDPDGSTKGKFTEQTP